MEDRDSGSLVQQMLSLGEERMGEVVNQLLAHEAFVGAVQRAVTSGLAAKRSLDTTVGSVLGAVNVPTLDDVHDVKDRLIELEDVLGEVEERVRRIADRVTTLAGRDDDDDDRPAKKPARKAAKKSKKAKTSD